MAALLKKRALAEYSQVIQEQPKPPKKLRLVKKQWSGGSAAPFMGLLEKTKTSNEALDVLLRISDTLQFQEEDLPEAVKKLAEHFQKEPEPAVRAKILSLFGAIGTEPGADIQNIIEEIIRLLRKEESHKVISQGVTALMKLGKFMADNFPAHQKLVLIAKQYLTDTSHSVKCKCLELIGSLLPVGGPADVTQSMIHLVGDFTHSQEPRVRSAAFKAMLSLHERGLKLDAGVYSEVCKALKDDYEIVRQAALKLIWVLAQTYPENIIVLPNSEEEIRLVDDAFGKVCNTINDLSMKVRTQAASLLGTMTHVSPKFLQQTLDKKLMSNMRKKRSAHERQWESVTSGEWSTGKRWADDIPREMVDADSVNLLGSSGACGAFVHGLEDEFLEVRSASVDSICWLSLNNTQFATLSLDFLVDMFNDEIEDVRLKAIDSLTRISHHIVLREDQLETILGALEDFSLDVREGLHRMLAACRLSTKGCLQMCVQSLLDNLKKYPQDRRSTWHCLKSIGERHPELTLPLVPELLSIHPFFDMPEPDVEDPAYICILILVFNSACHCPTMLELFEEHTLKHYSYLRDTMPSLVPPLKLPGISCSRELVPVTTGSVQFMNEVLGRLARSMSVPTSSPSSSLAPSPSPSPLQQVPLAFGGARIRRELQEAAQRDLSRLAEIDSNLAGAASFASLYISSQLLLEKVVSNKMWASPTAAASHQGNIVRNSINQLLQQCLKLQHLFVGLGEAESGAARQLKVRALALHLVHVVLGSNASALALCDHFLEQVDSLQRHLSEWSLAPDAFTTSMLKELSQLEDTKPGRVARCLLPIFFQAPPSAPPRVSNQVRMSNAVITEPTSECDNILKFTAGLVLAVPFDAEISNLRAPSTLRIKVKYPDQQTRLIVPPKKDLRPLPAAAAATSHVVPNQSTGASENTDFRLLTTVLVSHGVWTEACHVEVNIAVDVTEVEGGLGMPVRKGASAINPSLAPSAAPRAEDLCVIDLCRPVKVCVSPKPVKRGNF
ncbi:integrator complex subunit 4 [Hetaerina americana]|uniref:integrator complex subunit 4 n=1 Tax=Hetaerina americana TaxID=62018 RepID=UPI003A7F3B54